MDKEKNNSQKRVIVVASGRSIHTYNFIALVKDYFDELLLVTDFDDPQHNEVKKCILPASLHNPLKVFPYSVKYRRVIKGFNPNLIINIQLDTSALLSQLANRQRVKSIIICLGSDILTTPHRNIVLKLMAKYVLSRHDLFAVIGTEFVAKKMKFLQPSIQDLQIVTFGIDSSFETMSLPEKQNIVFSNRLHTPLYRIPMIIEAFARFVASSERADWRLIIAASGYDEELKSLTQKLAIEDKVDFVGWLSKEENAHYYSISKIWVSIPKSDCMPISMLEAMSSGCLPVVSDIGSTSYFLSNHKAVALIAKDLKSNFLEQAITLLSEQQREINKKIAIDFGSKDINRQKFYAMFDQAYKE